jgi:DNA primase small subunit
VARTAPLDAPTLAWARARFSEYYARADVPPPERIARREFAAFPFAGTALMRRHATLKTEGEFRAFLAREVPRHVYYSSAYYRRPAEPTMAAKEWLGADLIFDLDADHLRGAEALDYPGQLALVKERLIRLVDDFLFGDFGVDPSLTSLAFSGGRGYHVHVRDDRFLTLTSPERRELVDYILGIGFDVDRAWEQHREDVRAGRTVSTSDEGEDGPLLGGHLTVTPRLYPPDAPGWQGRATRAVLAMLSRWQREGVGVAAKEMADVGVEPDLAKRWANLLVAKDGCAKIAGTLSLDVFGPRQSVKFLQSMIRSTVARAEIEVQGETDAPVTTDIHRLIRLPGSLHGGTGFRVVPLPRDAIDRFDPFSDALVPAADSARTAVTLTQDAGYAFAGNAVRGSTGDRLELTTPAALFLVLRGEAALPPAPG